MMEAPMSKAFTNAPPQAITDFKQTMGIVFFFGDKELSPLINILILIVTGVVFLLLAVVSISVKKKQ
jgi:multidrug/hemolysin transport system permease protein